MENMPSEIENATRLPVENAGIRKNRSGIMACGLRCSHIRNAIARTTPPTSPATITGSLQPFWLASISA